MVPTQHPSHTPPDYRPDVAHRELLFRLTLIENKLDWVASRVGDLQGQPPAVQQGQDEPVSSPTSTPTEPTTTAGTSPSGTEPAKTAQPPGSRASQDSSTQVQRATSRDADPASHDAEYEADRKEAEPEKEPPKGDTVARGHRPQDAPGAGARVGTTSSTQAEQAEKITEKTAEKTAAGPSSGRESGSGTRPGPGATTGAASQRATGRAGTTAPTRARPAGQPGPAGSARSAGHAASTTATGRHPGPAPGQPSSAAGRPLRPTHQAPGQTGPGIVGRVVDRLTREGRIGNYLLSVAAALLVLSSAVSLLALVWDSIPDIAKVLALAVLGMVMTAGGVVLNHRRTDQHAAAATLAGTGGSLVFVSVIGAALLGLLPSLPAFALMAAWAVVLLIVSHATRMLFTAVVSTLGALVTIGFAWNQSRLHPEVALTSWTLILIYVLTLVLVCLLLSRGTDHTGLAVWYPATSLVATVTALFLTPVAQLVDLSLVVGAGIVLSLCVLLTLQVLYMSVSLWDSVTRLAAGWDWGAGGLVLQICLGRLLSVLTTGRTAHGPAPAVVYLLSLAVLAGTAIAIMRLRARYQWYHAVSVAHMLVAVLTSLVGFLQVGWIGLYPLTVLAIAVCLLPAVRAGRTEPFLVLAGTGSATVLYTSTPARGTALTMAALVVAVLLSALLPAVAEHLVSRQRTQAVPPAPQAHASGPATSPASTTATSPGAVPVLHTVVLVTALNLVLVLPAVGVAYFTPIGSQTGRGVFLLLPSILMAGLTALGCFSSGATPLTVLTGRRLGARYGLDRLDRGRTSPPGVPGASAQALAPWQACTCTAAMALVSAETLSLTWSFSHLAWVAFLCAGSAGLAAVATWYLSPWIRRTEVCLTVAIADCVLLWWAVLALSRQGIDSSLASAVVLATGAVCIGIGFRVRITVLRHYGLTLVLLAVLKLALLDIATYSSIVRVVSLAASGVVCFGLSLVYNRFSAEQREQEETTAAQQPQETP